MICAPSVPYEDEVARRWWSLPLNCLLPLADGGYYQLLFPGRPGGSTGPDVRDAVLATPGDRALISNDPTPNLSPANRFFGDIEFHVRSSDWRTHRHHTDPRYNAVMLHVVLICDDPNPTLRQDGTLVPVCSLYDLPWPTEHLYHAHRDPQAASTYSSDAESPWPCQHIVSALPADERDKLLTRAGLLRFEQKIHNFVELLHATTSDDAYDVYDACLIPAIAEGLGYGRDRDLFRAVGLRLLQKHSALPEPLGHTPQPAPLDAKRLHILALLLKRWRIPGAWQTLRACLLSTDNHDNYKGHDDYNVAATILATLRRTFTESGLSLARTDILIINVVLPFAGAVALLEQHTLLAKCAHDLYLHHPGLTSNRITRSMGKQLQLPREPQGSCQQQGLHYIYQQTCREKRCSICLMGKKDV